MHYPYPMYCRQYCYVRRAIIDPSANLLILISKSTNHPTCDALAAARSCVRVTAYESRLVIRPHARSVDNGFDYLLTYFDDPQSAFPSAAYSWMAYSGVPDFVSKLHAAAQRLHREQQQQQQQSSTSASSTPTKASVKKAEKQRTSSSSSSSSSSEGTSSSSSRASAAAAAAAAAHMA